MLKYERYMFFRDRSKIRVGGGGVGRAGANMWRAMVFHASTKGRVKQFGACH